MKKSVKKSVFSDQERKQNGKWERSETALLISKRIIFRVMLGLFETSEEIDYVEKSRQFFFSNLQTIIIYNNYSDSICIWL